MMLEEQRSCHLHTTILSKYVFWWKTECRVFSNFVSCSDQRKIGIVKFNKLLHNSFVLLTAALVWHQRNTSTHNYFSNACLIIVTTLGVFGLVIFLQLMSAIKSAHELWSNLHNDTVCVNTHSVVSKKIVRVPRRVILPYRRRSCQLLSPTNHLMLPCLISIANGT